MKAKPVPKFSVGSDLGLGDIRIEISPGPLTPRNSPYEPIRAKSKNYTNSRQKFKSKSVNGPIIKKDSCAIQTLQIPLLNINSSPRVGKGDISIEENEVFSFRQAFGNYSLTRRVHKDRQKATEPNNAFTVQNLVLEIPGRLNTLIYPDEPNANKKQGYFSEIRDREDPDRLQLDVTSFLDGESSRNPEHQPSFAVQTLQIPDHMSSALGSKSEIFTPDFSLNPPGLQWGRIPSRRMMR